MKHSLGFSLIEIMVVVVIIGILGAIVVPRIISRPEEARIVKAKADINVLQDACDLYKLDNGFYPSTDQGIKALVQKPSTDPLPINWKKGGYVRNLPTDPWGRIYHYLNPGIHNREGIDIFTYGPSGKPGGTDNKGAIGNWNS